MAFPVLGHVDAQQRSFIAIDGLGQRLGELGLAHAGRPEEQKSRHRLAAFAQPARDNRTASATARTASSWPTRRSCSRCSRCNSFSRSSTVSSLTGMPVRRETICATCSALTSALPRRARAPNLR